MSTDDQHAPRTGASALARMLPEYGVTHLFMVPAILRRTMAELELSTPIRRIGTHGEKAAAYMADGYARARNGIGVCAAQNVGAHNLSAGLREAWLAHSPVLAFTGGPDPATRYRHLYQEVEDMATFTEVTKFNAKIDDAERIPDLVRTAVRAATTGTPGPVHLQFRGNEGQVDREPCAARDYTEPQFGCVAPFRIAPDPDAVRATARMLATSQRPVILAGGGVRLSGAQAALLEVARRFEAPVVTSLNGKGTFGEGDPLAAGVVGSYGRSSSNALLARADFVLLLGTQAGSMTTAEWTLVDPGATVHQVDIDPQTVGQNYRVDVGALADARSYLAELAGADAGERGPERAEWLAAVRAENADWLTVHQAKISSDAEPILPHRIAHELGALLPADAIVVADTGNAGMWMAKFCELPSMDQAYLRSCGHLGWAFPAGIGAQCARPDAPTVVFTGDAGMYYHLAELETAVRWNVPLVVVVNNNSSGNQSRLGFERAYGPDLSEQSRELWTFRDVDFAAVAREFGALARKVTRPADFAAALDDAVNAEGPVVIDVTTDIDALPPA